MAKFSHGSIVTLGDFGNRKFVVGETLQGGMGLVYQLVPVDPFANIVALKTYKTDATPEQFLRESDIWFSIGKHQNIATALWYGYWNNQASILSEWYPSSARGIKPESRNPDQWIRFVQGLLEGLDFAYRSQGVIHQDIKPDNILLDSDGNPRISDFGVSTLVTDEDKKAAGTIGYFAPELLLGAIPSITTDIYSVGVTICEFLTGNKRLALPWDNNWELDLGKARSLFGKNITPVLNVISAAIQLDPGDRAGSYQELFSLLQIKRKTQQRSHHYSDEDTVAYAKVLQKQDRVDAAIGTLQEYLYGDPGNPIVRNALGTLYWKMGRKIQAQEQFETATETLLGKSGFHNGIVYCDPIANLANLFIEKAEYYRAKELLAFVWKWSQEKDPRLSYEYPELGWYLLFTGSFEMSCKLLLHYFKISSLNSITIRWYALSSFLSDKSPKWSESIYELLIRLQYFDLPISLSALLIANYLDESKSTKLRRKAFGDCHRELTSLSDEMGQSRAFEKYPLPLYSLHLILYSLDQTTTGGKYDETIQKSIQSSMG
jgi:serine/threonine protein kinase